MLWIYVVFLGGLVRPSSMAGSSCEHKVPLKEKICCRVLTIELVNLLLEIGLNLRVRLIMPKNSVAFRNNKKKKKKHILFHAS